MEFVSKKYKLKVTINDKVYEINSPTVGETEDLQAQREGKSFKEQGELTIKFIEKLGIPVEAQREIANTDYKDFIEFILDHKKKLKAQT